MYYNKGLPKAVHVGVLMDFDRAPFPLSNYNLYLIAF